MSSLRPLRAREAPKRLYRTLNLAEARLEFGLHQEQIYGAVARGEVHPVARPPRDRRSLRGQIEYPEWELRKLAADLGLTIPRLLPEIDDTNSKLSYFEHLAARAA